MFFGHGLEGIDRAGHKEPGDAASGSGQFGCRRCHLAAPLWTLVGGRVSAPGARASLRVVDGSFGYGRSDVDSSRRAGSDCSAVRMRPASSTRLIEATTISPSTE